MLIPRHLQLEPHLTSGKVLVLYGPRRVGKTTLIEEFKQHTDQRFTAFRGDDLSTQQAFSQNNLTVLQDVVGDVDLLIIDEAQEITGIGASLKLLVDANPRLAIIVSGSSSFELAGQVGEPLTGRKTTEYLFPIAVSELLGAESNPKHIWRQQLPTLLIYGMYPNALTATSQTDKQKFLTELVDSYLLKDILKFQAVKGSRVLLQLLAMLAYQVGQEVSLHELGGNLGVDKNTVSRYLDLLEKAFIIFRLSGLSRNLRNEITKKAKYYFYDVGVRNAVINNFNELDLRNDVGALWENFVIVERMKQRHYQDIRANQYFWRTWKGSEIDLVEERDGRYIGYEISWGDGHRKQVPAEWLAAYGHQADWQLITPQTFFAMA